MLFLAINLYQIVQLILERRDVRLSHEDQDLYTSVFSNLAVGEFRLLMKIGNRADLRPGAVLARQGDDGSEVMLVERGAIKLERDGRHLDQILGGGMIGEIAFVAGRPFRSTASAAVRTRIVTWKRADLNRLFLRRPALALGFHATFIGQLKRGEPEDP